MIKKFCIFLVALSLGILFSQIVKYKINSVENSVLSHSEISDSLNSSALSNLSEEIVNSQYENSEKANKRFGIAGVDDDIEVKKIYLKFQKAVAENDRKTVSTLLEYPLRVYYSTDVSRKKYRFIKNRKEFSRDYDKIFGNKLKKFIAKIDVENKEDIWARYDGIAVGRGVIWIGVFCVDNLCEEKNRITIRTIHGSSSFIEE